MTRNHDNRRPPDLQQVRDLADFANAQAHTFGAASHEAERARWLLLEQYAAAEDARWAYVTDDMLRVSE